MLDGVSAVTDIEPGQTYRVELRRESAMRDVLTFLVTEGVTSIHTSRPSLAEVYGHVIGERGLAV
jgi:ABC-2 type transport system ATP-binding protein